MKMKLLMVGALFGLAIAIIPFMYFVYCLLEGDLRISQIIGHGKYVVPTLLGGGMLTVFCVHEITSKKPTTKKLREEVKS